MSGMSEWGHKFSFVTGGFLVAQMLKSVEQMFNLFFTSSLVFDNLPATFKWPTKKKN